MSSDQPDISVIIVTHNSWPALEKCLRSVQAGGTSRTLELLIVDNASRLDPTHEIHKFIPDAHVIREDRNRGFAAGCNRAAGTARARTLLFLNPDVILDAGAIDRLYDAVHTHPQAGLVVPRLRNPDGSFQANCRRYPSLRNLALSRQSSIGRLIAPESSAYTLPDYPDTTAVPAVAATAMMVRRDVFEDAGRFDPRYFLFVEDTDLSYRVNSAGRENLFVPSAGAVHRWGRGSTASKIRRLYHHHVSLWKYFLKYRPNGLTVIALPPLLLLNALVMLILPDRRPPSNA